ncbi:hypothetical protein [Tropicimonas sp. IMCC34011]|nr:hypothetical protein [Tropicimonas sp. IMCC34011]
MSDLYRLTEALMAFLEVCFPRPNDKPKVHDRSGRVKDWRGRGRTY